MVSLTICVFEVSACNTSRTSSCAVNLFVWIQHLRMKKTETIIHLETTVKLWTSRNVGIARTICFTLQSQQKCSYWISIPTWSNFTIIKVCFRSYNQLSKCYTSNRITTAYWLHWNQLVAMLQNKKKSLTTVKIVRKSKSKHWMVENRVVQVGYQHLQVVLDYQNVS